METETILLKTTGMDSNIGPEDSISSASLRSPADIAFEATSNADSKKSGSESLAPPSLKKMNPTLCSFSEFQQMRSELILDNFDENGMPYSPNLHKMWVRYRRLQEQKILAEGSSEDKNKSPELIPRSQTFPGFHYRPDTRDVVYDDGSGCVLPAPGTWILNDKNELVSGPVPISCRMTTTPGPSGVPVFNPFLNYGADRSQEDNGPKIMRNRCYSDSQQKGDVLDSCEPLLSNDSGIEVDGELDSLPATPAHNGFKPSLNSTPHRYGNNSDAVSIFLREFQMLDTRCDDKAVEENMRVGGRDNYEVEIEQPHDEHEMLTL